MNELAHQISKFSSLGPALETTQLLVALILSGILSIIVAKVYQYSYRGVSYSPAFMQTLIICSMVIAAVMLIIGSNIARAFSLVGALSIIRFRNAVKDPRDVAFIFLVMGIGMACGTGFYTISVILTVVTCTCIVAMTRFGLGERTTIEKVLRIQAPLVANFEHLFDPILAARTESFSLLSIETTRQQTEMELVFSIRVPRKFNSEALISELSALNNKLKVQISGSNFLYDL